MKLDDIITMWGTDCRIDDTKIQSEITRTPILHQKYWDILIQERLLYEKLKVKSAEMEITLDAYYNRTLTSDELTEYILSYSEKRFLKADIKKHIDVHPLLVEIKLKMSLQHEKIRFLDDCIKMIHGRSFLLKDIIAHKVWESGG